MGACLWTCRRATPTGYAAMWTETCGPRQGGVLTISTEYMCLRPTARLSARFTFRKRAQTFASAARRKTACLWRQANHCMQCMWEPRAHSYLDAAIVGAMQNRVRAFFNSEKFCGINESSLRRRDLSLLDRSGGLHRA